MTRGRWYAILFLALIAAGAWYANDAGYVARGRSDYASWAEQRRLAADGRGTRGDKPTLFDLAMDKVAIWVPGR